MRTSAAIVLWCVASSALADEKKLSVTADVGICAHEDERAINTGGRAQVRVKGIEHYYLFNFDTTPIKFWQVTKATLHLKLAAGHLRACAVSTVPVAWVEGTADNKPQKGSSCYTHVAWPDKPWTDWGGTMLDATFNNPYMMWRPAAVTYDADGKWMSINLAPELVQAAAAGLSHGLVLSDEKGQTRENHDVFTREQGNAAPYLVVEGQAVHVAADLPRGVSAKVMRADPDGADFSTGAIVIDPSWVIDSAGKTKGGVWAHRITLRKPDRGPLAPMQPGDEKVLAEAVTFFDKPVRFTGLKPGEEYGVEVESLIGPQSYRASGDKVKAADRLAAPAIPAMPGSPPPPLQNVLNKETGWAIDFRPAIAKVPPAGVKHNAATPIRRPVAARNSWASVQAVIIPPDGKADDVGVQLTALEFQGPQSKEIPPLHPARLYRPWYITDGKDSHEEALIPLAGKPDSYAPPPSIRGVISEKFAIPWQENKAATPPCQTVFIDIWIPKTADPGPYSGKLIVKQDGKDVAMAVIAIDVADAVLGDEFKIVGSMNAYSSPAGAMGVKTSDPAAFMEAEREYYRLAHQHRMTLNALPYSQSGNIDWRGAPKITGSGKDIKFDWTEWDERFGPLLSGAAFSAKAGYIGPGQDTPIHHIYLPFHENWPVPLADHFKPWPPPKDYNELMKWMADLPAIENCLGGAKDSFTVAWQQALRQFGRFASRNTFCRTRFQIYLNNKHNFRDPKQGGRGISLWLLDEPMFSDDFLAIRYFGAGGRSEIERFRQWAPPPVYIDFRVDISRPTHQRNWLDGVVDLNVCAGQLYTQRWWIDYRKRTFGEEYWNYHAPPSFTADNTAWAAWPIQSYCWGATGTLPWQTIGKDGDFDKADATALMYPGKRFGLDEPLPSLRMKAWRDGLQDAEVLRMLREKMKWNDLQLRSFVGQAAGLDGWKDGRDPKEDAPIVTFAGMTAERLDSLRRATIAGLYEMK